MNILFAFTVGTFVVNDASYFYLSLQNVTCITDLKIMQACLVFWVRATSLKVVYKSGLRLSAPIATLSTRESNKKTVCLCYKQKFGTFFIHKRQFYIFT